MSLIIFTLLKNEMKLRLIDFVINLVNDCTYECTATYEYEYTYEGITYTEIYIQTTSYTF
jgi:hypothetical protein